MMRRSVFAVMITGLLLVACGDDAAGPAAAPVASSPVASSSHVPDAAMPEALQFSAPLVGGGSIDFTQYAGRTVALWFWAPT